MHESPAPEPAVGRAGDGVDPVGAVVVDAWVLEAEASALTADQLSARVLHHERERAALDARMAGDAAAWDLRQVWAGDGSSSGAAWLAPRAGLTAVAARKRMKVIRWLGQAPLVLAALSEARLTWPKVEHFSQQVTDACLERFAADEDMLVRLASELSVEDTVRMLRHWASKADPELDEHDEERRQEQRSVYLSETWLGMGDLAGNLTPECLLLLTTLLESVMDDLYRDEARGDVAERTTAQRRHDAMEEVVRRAAAWDAQNNKAAHPLLFALLDEHWLTGTPDGAEPEHAEADDVDSEDVGSDEVDDAGAFGMTASAAGGVDPGADGGEKDRSPPDGAHGRPSPKRRWRPPKAKATPSKGPAITNQIADRYACDGRIARLILGADGEVLDHGRAKRLFTEPQRRAILTRYDNTCPWGDCDRPAGWLEMHHVEEWEADHGPTDLANGIPPCRTHHKCLHEGGFSVTRHPNGDLTFYRPDGTPITTNPNTALWRTAG